MNHTRIASGLILTIVVALSASCGSSDNGGGTSVSTGGTTSASGGTGASAEGGSTTKASTTSADSVGGSTSATSGTKAVGGTTGTGTSTSASSSECPAEKPEVDGACTRSSSQGACTYDDTNCICSGRTWHCYTQSDCPASMPADEDGCELNAMACNYGEVRCTCSTQSGWSCATPCPETKPTEQGKACTRAPERTCRYGEDDKPVSFGGTAVTTCACADGALTCFAASDCPAEPPSDAAACTMLTISCEYDDRNCSCGTDAAWACVTECPATAPAADAACSRDIRNACSYDTAGALIESSGTETDKTCVCSEGKFVCYTDADCPATAPENDLDCTQLGLNCSYDDDETTCRCRTSTSKWSCNSSNPGNNGTAGAPNVGAGGSTGAGGSVSVAGRTST